MKQAIIDIYLQLPPEARAGLCNLMVNIVFAVEHDPNIIPLLITRPCEQTTVEKYEKEITEARAQLITLLSQQ